MDARSEFKEYHLLQIHEIVPLFQQRGYKFNVRLFHSWVVKKLIPRTLNGFFMPDIVDHISSIFEQRGRGFSFPDIREELHRFYGEYSLAIPESYFSKEHLQLEGNADLAGIEPGQVPLDPEDFRKWITSFGILTKSQVEEKYLRTAQKFLRDCLDGGMANHELLRRLIKQVYDELNLQCKCEAAKKLSVFIDDEMGRLSQIPAAYKAVLNLVAEFYKVQIRRCYELRKEMKYKLEPRAEYIRKGVILLKQYNIYASAAQELDDLNELFQK